MSGSGSFAVSRTHGGDRFYNPPAVRRQQQQQQLLLQQQQQRNGENRTDSDSSDGSTAAAEALSNPPSVCSPPPPPLADVTNLDRFLESVTPSVLAQFSSELQENIRSLRGGENELYYGLGDLWDSFGEWSVYGVGVPLVLNGQESVVQYYVPFLSGLQLYVTPVKTPSHSRRPGEDSNVEFMREASSDCEAESGYSPGTLIFEYMERESPHNRKPLADKISALASEFPDIKKYKSSDLSPASWISVAWYPIYRIPVGPTLKDLDASFLTFHSLSTSSSDNGELRTSDAVGGVEAAFKVPLPVFGLASYKLKGSILSPFGPLDSNQENSLSEAAANWLRNLKAIHPDYQFFLHHFSQWRG